jgi:hypothetical protein
MSDKYDIQRLPAQGILSIAPSEPRSGLIARGRKDAASLKGRETEPGQYAAQLAQEVQA